MLWMPQHATCWECWDEFMFDQVRPMWLMGTVYIRLFKKNTNLWFEVMKFDPCVKAFGSWYLHGFHWAVVLRWQSYLVLVGSLGWLLTRNTQQSCGSDSRFHSLIFWIQEVQISFYIHPTVYIYIHIHQVDLIVGPVIRTFLYRWVSACPVRILVRPASRAGPQYDGHDCGHLAYTHYKKS